MGIPVLHGVAGESADIVQREKVGLVFEPENVDQLVQALWRLHSDAALSAELRAAGPLAASRYDRRALGMGMLDIVRGCVQQPGGVGR